MCNRRGAERGLAGAPCFALAVLVRERYPDATAQLVQDFENVIAAYMNENHAANQRFFHDPVAAVAHVWRTVVAR